MGNNMTEYMIKPNEISVLAESLKELFAELGDNVNPKLVAERMQLKTGRTYQYHQTSYLLRLCGFTTRKLEGRIEGRNNYYIIQDDELIERLRKESPQITERTKNKTPELSVYSKECNRTDVNLFEPNLRSNSTR
jgi:hypothetical protein